MSECVRARTVRPKQQRAYLIRERHSCPRPRQHQAREADASAQLDDALAREILPREQV